MKKKILSFTVIAAMVVAILAPAPVMAKKKAKELPLVKSATYYYYSSYDKKWEKDELQKFTYKKGYPDSIITLYQSSSNIQSPKYKLKKKGKKYLPKKMTIKPGFLSTRSYKYNKKGFLTNVTSKSKSSRYTYAYKYNSKGFVTQRSAKYYYKNDSGKFVSNGNYVDKYAVKMKKGLPKSITYTESDGYKRVWTCNKKGLITSTTEYFPSGTVYSKHTYKYKYKKGRVVSVTEYNTEGTATERVVFKYSKEKANKQRYAQMINDLINAGYPSNWY